MAEFSWLQLWVTVGTAAIGLFGGVKLSRYQFDLNRQRTEKQAASALRADLERITAALGEVANLSASSFYGMTFEPPKLHRWSEPVIVQLAAADARIVSGCMDLDRELNNFDATLSLYRQRAEAHAEARDVLRRVLDSPADDSMSDLELLQRAGNRVTAESRIEESADQLAEALRLMGVHHTKSKAIIADLLRYTSAIADARDQEFMQLPEELPRLTD